MCILFIYFEQNFLFFCLGIYLFFLNFFILYIFAESSRNFSIYTRDQSGELENHFFLGHDKVECTATEFHINDTHGGNLFSVNQKEVNIGAHTLKIDGEGGAIFRESIQTSHVRAEPGRELK